MEDFSDKSKLLEEFGDLKDLLLEAEFFNLEWEQLSSDDISLSDKFSLLVDSEK